MNDWELIQSYCRSGSETAFEALVKRHVDYVYCAALRQVRDPSLAEDVTQAVFMLLARKAKGFRSGTVLVSWLFRTTHFIARCALRSEYRRQRRELEAATMNPSTTTPESDPKWELVSPLLDEALAALPNKDREAVLLRFISRKPFSQVGAEIGASEDAAKKRVARALVRLREFFVRRGTMLSVAALGMMLGERLVHASPAALAAKITSAAGAGGAAAASASAAALLKASLRDLFWTKARWGAAISAGLMAVIFISITTSRSPHDKMIVSASPAPAAQERTSIGSNRVSGAGDSGPVQNSTQHTLSLLVARAEDQKPIPGAHVLVESSRGKESDRTLDATTDTNGILEIPIPTEAFSGLRIWVSAEGRAPMSSDWQAYEFNEPIIMHTLLLESGQTAAGTVQDESGNPVAGAKVHFSGPGGGALGMRDSPNFQDDLSASVTDANGHWTTTQLPGAPMLVNIRICVEPSDFTPAQPYVARLPGFPTNALVIVSNGIALSGRVLAADGTPIANAEVSKLSGAYLKTITDTNGYFYWPHIEQGQVLVGVDAHGYETLYDSVLATNAANAGTLTLTRSADSNQPTTLSDELRVRLHGTVVDAENGEPIPSFRVLEGNLFQGSMMPTAGLLGDSSNGQFDWELVPTTGRNLEVEADGYLASISKAQVSDAADQEFNFELRRGTILTGRVVTPDGSPAENAAVGLVGENMGNMMDSPGKLIEWNLQFEAMKTRTDREGKFRLSLVTGAHGLVVAHESGSALVTFTAATNAPIVLQPWGAIDGTLYVGGKPAPNQPVSAHGIQKLDADPQAIFFFGYRTNTDERGHFRFEKVLPCETTVERKVGTKSDHSAKVTVESGEVASVELKGRGRPVIGRIIFQGSPADVRWNESSASLKGEKVYPFALSQDGALRADDVPPGTYKLSIRLANAINGWYFNKYPSRSTQKEIAAMQTPEQQTPIGSLEEEVVVPPAEDESVPVDLGELTVARAK